MKPDPLTLLKRETLQLLAESCGAKLTGTPDGQEPITVVFTVDAWRQFLDSIKLG